MRSALPSVEAPSMTKYSSPARRLARTESIVSARYPAMFRFDVTTATLMQPFDLAGIRLRGSYTRQLAANRLKIGFIDPLVAPADVVGGEQPCAVRPVQAETVEVIENG